MAQIPNGKKLLKGQKNAIEDFLAYDPSLNGRTVLEIFISTQGFFKITWPNAQSAAERHPTIPHSRILPEVNAAFLLRDKLASAEGEESLLQHPNLLAVPSHRQVLLLQVENESGWAIATSQTSASIITALYDLFRQQWIDYFNVPYRGTWLTLEGAEQIRGKIRELYHNQLEKVNSRLDFLEQRGYYKRPEDPAVPQRPFARFENITEMEESSEGKEACIMPSLKEEC